VTIKPIDQNKCDHEPDPDTIQYDKKVGRRATCIKCGAPLVLIKMHRRPGEKAHPTMKTTASDRREAKRRNYAQSKNAKSE